MRTQYRGEIWQGKLRVAEVQGTVRRVVERDAAHYAVMYSQDGPVEMRFFQKLPNQPWRRVIS